MPNNYGPRIKAARKKSGLKQREVAAKMGICERGFTQWESNHRVPTLRTLKKISDILGCDIRDLLPDEMKYEKIKEQDNPNPYWERITAIAEKQRAKGVSKYGQGLEANPADILARINHLQEELIDGLMYCEWIKEWVQETTKNAFED